VARIPGRIGARPAGRIAPGPALLCERMERSASVVAVQRGAGAGPLVVAHRGAWRSGTQNSLAAFEQAISLGCDVIELDVRRTGDGRVVVMHGARIGVRPVARLAHHQLEARMKDGQAATLEQVLELAGGRIALDLELKEDGYVEQVMAIVGKRLAPDQYVVSSFLDSVLPAVKRACPDARTGLLLSPRRRVRELEQRVRAARVDFLAPHASLARGGLLGWASVRGLPSWVWTVNDLRPLRALLADGRVAAVITDRPDRALALLHSVDMVYSRE
jgi:glycerophosphoryl diester phosphodiesterase